MDNGKPLKESLWDIGDVASCFEYCRFITVIKCKLTNFKDATLAEELDAKQSSRIDVGEESFNTTVEYAPVGVAAAIIPWNYVSLVNLSPIAKRLPLLHAATPHGCMEISPSTSRWMHGCTEGNFLRNPIDVI